ncbi:MAG: Inositol transport system permease protein, partial [uncultured Thermomicrobiales bacterium]
ERPDRTLTYRLGRQQREPGRAALPAAAMDPGPRRALRDGRPVRGLGAGADLSDHHHRLQPARGRPRVPQASHPSRVLRRVDELFRQLGGGSGVALEQRARRRDHARALDLDRGTGRLRAGAVRVPGARPVPADDPFDAGVPDRDSLDPAGGDVHQLGYLRQYLGGRLHAYRAGDAVHDPDHEQHFHQCAPRSRRGGPDARLHAAPGVPAGGDAAGVARTCGGLDLHLCALLERGLRSGDPDPSGAYPSGPGALGADAIATALPVRRGLVPDGTVAGFHLRDPALSARALGSGVAM